MKCIISSKSKLISWISPTESPIRKPKITSDIIGVHRVNKKEEVIHFLESKGITDRKIDWRTFESDGFLELLSELNSPILPDNGYNEDMDITYYTLVNTEEPRLSRIKRSIKIGIIQSL